MAIGARSLLHLFRLALYTNFISTVACTYISINDPSARGYLPHSGSLRASLDLAGQAETRPNSKILSKGEDRSPLKYIINVLLSGSEYFIEKSLASRLEFGFLFLKDPNSYREVKLLMPKVPKSIAM